MLPRGHSAEPAHRPEETQESTVHPLLTYLSMPGFPLLPPLYSWSVPALGCYNKMPHKQKNFASRGSGGWKAEVWVPAGPGSGHSPLWDAGFLLWQKGLGIPLQPLSYGANFMILKAPPS